MKYPNWKGIVLGLLLGLSGHLDASELKIAYFAQDPPSIVPLSPAFDPDSYTVIAQIFDGLVYLDLNGHFQPGLATSWQPLTDTRWVFRLRRGVKFHNGEDFNAQAVKFTFDYILNPENQAGNNWIFSSLESVETVPQDPYVVIFNTKFPDGLFLNRLNLFSSICPPKYIQEHGIEHFQQYPVGTGPYQFESWLSNQSIRLKKNPNYWQKGLPHIDYLNYVIVKTNDWLAGFEDGTLDFIPNLSGNNTGKLMRQSVNQARIIKRPVLASYFVLLKNQGALASLDVRKALNHAINKDDIIRFADFGNALPMSSIGKSGEFGANPQLTPYEYSPRKARTLLKNSGVTLPIKLKALVADTAVPAAKIIQQNLKVIGVDLTLEIVSRTEWSNRVVIHKIKTGQRPDYDMVINFVDNPMFNLAFHAGLFLESGSPWSLLDSPEFDKRFTYALQVVDLSEHEKRLQALDKYVHDNALLLFTTQKIITAAVRKKFDITEYNTTGHLNYEVLTRAKVVESE
ncbi:ABC transporter substrate-binding protein [Aliikangiella marina]|uniref:ABC transporter substrate-binding protein n=1 Tax=Aliikangiella marina TaxID=1712262 RepID=A0A545TA35_9GAMM|nr:ABC transporter substrate-binding protein [Aliikangiella marina]TQV74082.1 ABC transporter substrate-binding protein [Aliikangiella marina]